MKKAILVFCFSLILQITFGQTAINKDQKTIKSMRAASNEAIARHDLPEMAKYWTDDLVLVRGNSTRAIGKDINIADWQKLFRDNPKVSYIRTPSEIIISKNDTLAWETGSWKAFNSYSKGGNYSAMWKKSTTGWKIVAELFVSLL